MSMYTITLGTGANRPELVRGTHAPRAHRLMALEPGTTLGPYAVTAKIGEGGMGEVYRARDTKRQLDAVARLLQASPVGRDLRCGHRVRENAVRRRPPGVAADDQAPVVPLCGRLSILVARRE